MLRKRLAQGDAEVLESRPYRHPVTVTTSTTLESVDGQTVVLRDRDFQRTTIEGDDIVTCPTRPVAAGHRPG